MIPTEIKEVLMDFLKTHWKKGAAVAIAVTLGLSSIKFLGKDNMIEQKAEKVIESETGILIDLSP